MNSLWFFLSKSLINFSGLKIENQQNAAYTAEYKPKLRTKIDCFKKCIYFLRTFHLTLERNDQNEIRAMKVHMIGQESDQPKK